MDNLCESNWVQFKAGCKANRSFNLNQFLSFKDIVVNWNKVVVLHFVSNSKAANSQIVEIFQTALAPSQKIQVQNVASQ